MWSLQREETVSFDLTSKGMCLLFYLGLPVQQPPRVSGPSKLGWWGKRELFELNFGRKRVDVFGKDVNSQCSFPFANACERLRAPTLVYHFYFFYFRILVTAHVIIYTLYWKTQRLFCLLSHRAIVVIAEFIALELLKAEVWRFLSLAPLTWGPISVVEWCWCNLKIGKRRISLDVAEMTMQFDFWAENRLIYCLMLS